MLQGSRKLNEVSEKEHDGTLFKDLTEEQKITMLTAFQAGEVEMELVSSAVFFNLLRTLTLQGCFGDPLIRVTFDYTEMDHKRNEFLVEKCAEVAKEMGADIIDIIPMDEHFGGRFAFQHDAGGVIMGANPESSAVNNYLQMWDVDNLFVCGASAFPHFGPTNPTPTVAALTYRATEGMIEFLKNDGGPLVDAK